MNDRVLPKPKRGEKCNGCGLCCATQLCRIAEEQFPGAVAPCPALEFEDGRTYCGMVRHPSRHMKINFTGADETIAPMISMALGIGRGCDAED